MNFFNLIDSDINEIKGKIISVIGGGGKSTLLQKLGAELVKKKLKVILTTTTKMQWAPNVGLVLTKGNQNFDPELKVMLEEQGIVLVASDYYKSREKLIGVHYQFLNKLKRRADVVIVEADGSRQRSLKTHKEDEPVISSKTKAAIIICGADVVGEPLTEKIVHRAKLFAQKWNLPMGTTLTPEIIAKELLSPHSYLRNIPIKASISILINKADQNSIGAKLLAEHLTRKCRYPIFVGSLKKNQLKNII